MLMYNYNLFAIGVADSRRGALKLCVGEFETNKGSKGVLRVCTLL